MASHTWTDASRKKLSETRKRRFAEGSLEHHCPGKVTAVPSVSVPDAFGYWLAGFADGEGCFGAYAVRGRVHVMFKIALRIDDRAVLDDACQRTGLGNVRVIGQGRETSASYNPNRAPGAVWSVCSAAECLAIADLFRRFPLRAKKSRELAPWTRIASAVFNTYRLAPEAVQEDLALLSSLKGFVSPAPFPSVFQPTSPFRSS